VQTPGVVFDYVELVRDACGYTCARHEAQEIINTHIRNLRHKLGIEPDQPLYIESVRSMGYRLLESGA
jgi:DNA-binding response OmpR family regulator